MIGKSATFAISIQNKEILIAKERDQQMGINKTDIRGNGNIRNKVTSIRKIVIAPPKTTHYLCIRTQTRIESITNKVKRNLYGHF